MRFLAFWSGVVCLIVLSRVVPAAAQPAPANAPPLDLDALLAEVQAANPMLQAARLEAEALAQRRAQVSLLPDPTVMLTYQPFPVLTARGTQRTQLRVEQMIPYPGKLALQGDLADLSAEMAGYDVLTSAQDLFVEAKKAYYDLYRIQQQAALIRQFQDRLRDFEAVATTQYEVGRGLQQAILKAQLERNTLAQQHLRLVRERRTALALLDRLRNRPTADTLATVPTLAPPAVPSLDADALLALALAHHPEAAALDVASQRARTGIALAERQFLPDFGVNVTYFDIGRADMPPTANGRDALALGVSVKVPLQRDRLKAQLEEARLRQAQVGVRQEALETAFRTQIDDLVATLRQEQAQLDLYQQALLPQAATTLAATLSAYTTGRTDFLNLLDAERMRYMLRMGYEDTLARYLKATAALERTLGISSLNTLTVP